MTVAQLTVHLTREELIGWAAFYELKSEQEERVMDRAKTGRGARTMASRQTGARLPAFRPVANYNVDIEVGLKGLNRLQQFKRELEGVDTAYLNIISVTKRLEKQGGLKKFYEGGREQLLKLAGDQMKLDSLLKQGAEIRAGYAKDRKLEQQKQAEAEQKAAAQRIADEKQAAIEATAGNLQRLNDLKKIRVLNDDAAKIRKSYDNDRLVALQQESQREENLAQQKLRNTQEQLQADRKANKERLAADQAAEKRLVARQKMLGGGKTGGQKFNAAITGGAFPLLFGGGPGQALGGLIGGGLSGEMFSGLTVGLQVLGSAVDRMITASADLGKALDPISGDFEAVAEAAGLANTATLEHIQTIEELGEKNRALEISTAELTRIVGADGVAALKRFGAASQDLANSTSQIASQAFASIAAALEPLTRAAANFLKTTAVVGQAQVSQDPRIKAIRGEMQERMRTYDNQFGGMNNLENRQAIRDLRQQELEIIEKINKEARAAITIEANNLKVLQNVEAMNLKTLEQLELENQIIAAGNDLTEEKVQTLREEQIELDFTIKKQELIERLNDGEITARATVLAIKQLENDRTRDLAQLQEQINKALGRGTKSSEKTVEHRARELDRAQDLAKEFAREVQLREAGTDLARDLLQIGFDYEDRINKINELENQSLALQQQKNAEKLRELAIQERLAEFATTRTEGEVARDDMNREIMLLEAKLKGTEEEFLTREKIERLEKLGVENAENLVLVFNDLLKQYDDKVSLEETLTKFAENRQQAEKQAAEELKATYEQIGKTIESGVVEAITSAIDKTKDLGAVASSVLMQIANIFLQMGIGQVSDVIKSFFDPSFIPFPGHETHGNVPMQPLPPVPKALGGAVGPGQPYLVGEKGPELFVPGAQGNIVPNNAMGGSNIVVNVDASGSSVEGDAQQSKALGQALGAAVQAEIIKQKMPGGLLA